MGRNGEAGEAAALKRLTGHLVVRLESPPWLGEQLHPLLHYFRQRLQISTGCKELPLFLFSEDKMVTKDLVLCLLTDHFNLFYRKFRLNNLS